MNPPTLPTKRRIKRFAPLQLGLMLAVLYGLCGLIFAPIFVVVSTLGLKGTGQPATGLMAAGLGVIVLLPVIYAAVGFVGGLLGALIYNMVARWVGGIEVEVE
ncbi:MAG: hypothetical protein JSS11_03275 [Verrucomicrobia bacterium]|nr:hypothetical protein [Verrucomicrobiota bacterium]